LEAKKISCFQKQGMGEKAVTL